MIKKVLAAILVLFCSFPTLARTEAQHGLSTPVVKVDSGPVSGIIDDGISTYLGIPYAKPPVGDLRWRTPQKVSPWKVTRKCLEFGPACPQPNYLEVGRTNEDCLYLNVWTPAKSSKEKLPVMVFIHGGAFTVGSAAEKDYDGANFARLGVVFVSINYRLGPFGFLSHPLLSKDSANGVSGNYGLMDQSAAIKWVSKNISAFGGDPENVTIIGESAGSISVNLQMIMPASKGLFKRVIAESGGPYGLGYLFPNADGSMDKALKVGEKFSKALKANTLKDMRRKTSDEILAAFDFSLGPISRGMKFGPVFDGFTIPGDPKKLFAEGKQGDLQILIGSNTDEGNLFYKKMSLKEYKGWIKSRFKGFDDEVFAMFPAKDDQDVREAFNKLLTAAMFSEPARFAVRCGEKNKTKNYLYKFTRVPNTAMAKKMGSYHSVELPYVFGHLKKEQGYNDYDIKLSNIVRKYWTNFAKSGNPNGRRLPYWPEYKRKTDQNLELGSKIRIKKNLLKKECDLIDRLDLDSKNK
ncbi:MAG: carboxylesterase family protein [Candidatus Saganbacteria bacterium]|nr:carboxylesterase family protein [Candidatus Saganbacteria bacterium]